MPKLKWNYRTVRRTNEPGTCLYCGRPLPIYRGDTTWLYRGHREGDDEWQDRLEEKKEEGWVLKFFRHEGANARFHREGARRGVFGNGHFHSGTCAESFGVAFAILGYKLNPRDNSDDEENG